MPRTQNFSAPRKRNFPWTVGRPSANLRGVGTSGGPSETVISGLRDARLLSRGCGYIRTQRNLIRIYREPHAEHDWPGWLSAKKPSSLCRPGRGRALHREMGPMIEGLDQVLDGCGQHGVPELLRLVIAMSVAASSNRMDLRHS